MGRGLDDDPAYFVAAAAAGRYAASLAGYEHSGPSARQREGPERAAG